MAATVSQAKAANVYAQKAAAAGRPDAGAAAKRAEAMSRSVSSGRSTAPAAAASSPAPATTPSAAATSPSGAAKTGRTTSPATTVSSTPSYAAIADRKAQRLSRQADVSQNEALAAQLAKSQALAANPNSLIAKALPKLGQTQGDYNIVSPEDVMIANGIRNGEMEEYVNPADGSRWSRDANGNLRVTDRNGVWLNGVIGGPTVDQSRPNATLNPNQMAPIGLTGQYNITTDKGLNAVNDLLNGRIQYFNAPDGSTWTTDGRGNIIVATPDGRQLTGVMTRQYNPYYTEREYYNADQRDAEMNQLLRDYYDLQERYAKEQARIATEQGIADLNANYDNMLNYYNQLIERNAIDSARAADNLALRNAAAGETGGIGQKLYSDQQLGYDQQLLNIELEQINLKNDTEQEIAKLQSQGRREEAQILSELATARMQALQNESQYYQNLKMSAAQAMDSYSLSEQQVMFDQAMNKLSRGFFTAADAAAIGVPEDDAQAYASMVNQMAQIDLASAQAALEAAYGGGGTRRSGGGGGGTRTTGTGGGGLGDSPALTGDPELDALIAQLYGGNVPVDANGTPVSGSSDVPAEQIAPAGVNVDRATADRVFSMALSGAEAAGGQRLTAQERENIRTAYNIAGPYADRRTIERVWKDRGLSDKEYVVLLDTLTNAAQLYSRILDEQGAQANNWGTLPESRPRTRDTGPLLIVGEGH